MLSVRWQQSAKGISKICLRYSNEWLLYAILTTMTPRWQLCDNFINRIEIKFYFFRTHMTYIVGEENDEECFNHEAKNPKISITYQLFTCSIVNPVS